MARLFPFRFHLFLGLVLLLIPFSIENISVENSRNKVFFASPNFDDSLSNQFSYGLGFFEHFKLELELERFLRNQIAPYIDPNTFFLSVTYEPYSMKDSTGTSDFSPELLSQLQANVLNDVSKGQPDNEVKKLPGLPEYWKRNPRSGLLKNDSVLSPTVSIYDLEQLISKEILLGKVKVHFITDPIINLKIRELLYKLSFYTLKLHAFESYEISFEEIPTLNLIQPPLDTLKDSKSTLIQSNDGLAESEKKADNMLELSELIQDKLLLLVVIGAFLSMIIIFLLVFFNRRRKPVSEPLVRSVQDNELEDTKNFDNEVFSESADDIEEQEGQITLNNFQDFFVNHTSEIGKVFSFWIEDFGEVGLKKVHSILMPMGKNMYTLLFPYLSKKSTKLLLKSFHKNLPSTDTEEREIFLKELVEVIRTQIGIDSLAILKSLDRKELFGLIDLLENKEASMTLYHIDKNIRIEYLQTISPSRASEILISMVDVRTMNISDFEKLGETISQKLYQLRFFKKHQMKDLDFILDSIDLIDEENQKYILENFRSKDPILYRQLKKFIFSWNDLQYQEPNLIKEATIDFSPEELSKAYPLRPKELDLLISVRPKREQQLIYDLVNKKSDTSLDESKSILNKILKSIILKIRSNETSATESI
ncbi:hypothetical protein [uncultured Algoriphagus sp.]|uniref:hypothetical protein n=1 Tax=uncultured Algoriphagus sp. TaxID=417365 RepID=UPI0025920247|nr:hypothetical protein [uncultured Algoriphagus sp.]